MKKLCLLLLAASVSLGTMAHDHGGKKGKKSKHEKKAEKRWDNDDRLNDNRNADWRTGNNRGGNNEWNNNGNVPRKVRDAFNRDYPSARNVNWSKNRGTWTASFRRSGLFGGNQTVSYQANGKRTNNNQWQGNNNRNNRNSGNRNNDRDDD